DDQPTHDNKDQPQSRNERAGLAHQMKPEYVQGNKHNHPQERGDEQEHDYLIRQRLSLLHRRLETFIEQILSAREDDDHRRGRADQDQSEEHPGAGPLESARRQEQQDAEKDEIVDNTEDHLGDKAVRFTAAVTLLHYVCTASVFLIFLRLLRFFVVDFHCFRALITHLYNCKMYAATRDQVCQRCIHYLYWARLRISACNF